MDSGGRLLAALLRQGSVFEYHRCKLAEKFFVATEAKLWQFIEEHVGKYGKLPTVETVEEAFSTLPKTPEPPEFYLNQVEERYFHKRILTSLTDATALMKKQQVSATRGMLSDLMTDLRSTEQRMEMVNFGQDAFAMVKGAYVAKLKDVDTVIDMGWETFDQMNGGLMPGDVVSIVGRPAMGKTWFLLWTGMHAWRKRKRRVLVVTMEMAALPIVQRLGAIYAQVNSRQIMTGALTDIQLSRLNMRLKKAINVEEGTLWIVDGNMRASVEDIFALVEQLEPDLLLIDGPYLLKHKDPRLNKTGRVEANLEEIKYRAQRDQIPCVLSYQFNREAVKKLQKAKGQKVGLEDIAFSDSVGQISSIVIGLFEDESVETLKKRRLSILKGRGGEVGEFNVRWDFDNMDFSEITKKDEEADMLKWL